MRRYRHAYPPFYLKEKSPTQANMASFPGILICKALSQSHLSLKFNALSNLCKCIPCATFLKHKVKELASQNMVAGKQEISCDLMSSNIHRKDIRNI